MTHLAQMLAVFPGCYILTPTRTIMNGARVGSLVISIPGGIDKKENTELDLNIARQALAPPSTLKINSCSIAEQVATAADCARNRRVEFQNLLAKRIEAIHASYLIDNKLVVSSTAAWHPLFNVDKAEQIELASLPVYEPPSKFDSLRSKACLSKATLISSLLPSSPLKPVDISSTPSPSKSVVGQDQVTINSARPISRAQALLERVREKQRLRELADKANPKPTPEMIKRRSVLGRLCQMASCIVMFPIAKLGFVRPLNARRIPLHGSSSIYQPASSNCISRQVVNVNPASIQEHILEICRIAPFFSQIVLDGRVLDLGSPSVNQLAECTVRINQTTSKGLKEIVQIEMDKASPPKPSPS